MSRFHGPQGKGALARHRAKARAAAEERQIAFQIDVNRIAFEQNITEAAAKHVAAASRHFARRKAARRATAPITTPRSLS